MGMMTKPTKDNMIGFIMSSRAMTDNILKTSPEWWQYIRNEYEQMDVEEIQIEFDFFINDLNRY